MRRYTLSFMLSLAMVFSLVNVDLSNMFENPAEMVSIGPDAAEARRGSSSSRSSSRRASPSRPRPSKPRAAPPRAAPAKPKPAPPRAAPAKPKPGTSTAKPAPSTRDSATRAAARTQSKVKRAGATPKPAIKTSSGKTIKVAGTPAASSVRSMPAERYNTRSSRSDSYYSSRVPAGQRTVIINRYGGGYYGDPYSGLFMYSLLSMSLHNQAMYHHNHWNSYSAQRQQQLIAENAALKAEMASMTAQPRNPNYAPEGVDPDLMYSDEFVNAAYNPAPAPVVKEKGFPVFWTLFAISVLGIGTYFVFFRRTGTVS